MVLVIFVVVLRCITDSAVADCSVTNCDPNFCNDNLCTKCNGAYYKTDNGNCNQCYLNCRRCDGNLCNRCVHDSCDACISNCSCSSNNIYCPGCPDGYYKAGSVCYKCHFTNCKCSGQYDCIECLPGKYGTSNRCHNSCPRDCVTCIGPNDCTECIDGKYGPSCQMNCTNICDDGTCDNISGLCVGGCALGQYLATNNDCRNCSSRCDSCIDFHNCVTCKRRYYWGQTCQLDCNGCYENCNKDYGCTSECDAVFYKIYDQISKGYVCIHCPDNCATCNSSALCSTCESGHWGSICQHNCIGCSSNCDKSKGCSAGCRSGYYQNVISGGFQCERCPYKCALCRNDISCDECENSYYSLDGINCSECPGNCKDENCNTKDGSCLEGCQDDWFGLHCNESCPSNCEQCDQLCMSCKIGFYGDRCEHNCSMYCKQENGLQICYKRNGTCVHGCEAGSWGHFFDLLCESGCNGNVCNETAGICLNGCEDRFYGSRCDNECSPNCLSDPTTLRSCDESTGNCRLGCKDGWFGNNCNFEWDTTCKKLLCFQHNGTCVIESQCSCQTNIANTTPVVVLSVMLGIAVLLAAVSITGNVIVLKRRQLCCKQKTCDARPNVPEGQELDNNDYQDLNRTESADEAYSTVTHEYENAL